jgi:mevalonate pyrophosphate decarboxylase
LNLEIEELENIYYQNFLKFQNEKEKLEEELAVLTSEKNKKQKFNSKVIQSLRNDQEVEYKSQNENYKQELKKLRKAVEEMQIKRFTTLVQKQGQNDHSCKTKSSKISTNK